jgi:cytochrome c biogenesis protein CcdA
MNKSFDLVMLLVAAGLVALAFLAGSRSRSRTMRMILYGIGALMIVLMLWNLATHGGFHAV